MVSTCGVEHQCVFILICDDRSEGNTPESRAGAAIARQYSLFCYVDGVGVVKIDLRLVIHRRISGLGELTAAE